MARNPHGLDPQQGPTGTVSGRPNPHTDTGYSHAT